MSSFKITNITKNKVVLTVEARDEAHAAGKYISAMSLVGIVTHCEKDVKFNAEFNKFTILSKGWDFTVEAA